MCEVHDRVEGGGLGCWPDGVLKAALLGIEASRGRADAAQALVLAELVRRGRAPEAMFGSKVSSRDAQRRTKTAIALCDGSLPGAAAALAAGEVSFEHVAALAAVKDRLPDGAAQSLLPLAATLPPEKFARAAQRAAIPTAETAEGSTGTTARGGRWFRFGFDGYEGTIVLNGLEAVMDRQWRRDHPDRADEKLERPPWGHRLAGALLEMARDALAGHTPTVTDAPVPDAPTPDDAAPDAPAPQRAAAGRPVRALPEIIIVITYDKMFADADAAGICTTIDGTPLPVATVRQLLVDAKIYPLVLGGDGEILDFGRSRRFFSAAQKKATAARDLTCQFADCDQPIRYTHYHHCTPFGEGGLTDTANAAPACPTCHDKLTNDGYRLERRNGTTYTYAPNGQLIHQRNNRWQQ